MHFNHFKLKFIYNLIMKLIQKEIRREGKKLIINALSIFATVFSSEYFYFVFIHNFNVFFYDFVAIFFSNTFCKWVSEFIILQLDCAVNLLRFRSCVEFVFLYFFANLTNMEIQENIVRSEFNRIDLHTTNEQKNRHRNFWMFKNWILTNKR